MARTANLELLLSVAVEAARRRPADVVPLLVERLRVFGSEDEGGLEYLPPLDDPDRPRGSREATERLARSLIQALAGSREAGWDLGERVAAVHDLPDVLQRRILAAHLVNDIDAMPQEVTRWVVDRLLEHRSNPEGIALVRALTATGDRAVDDALGEGLGPVPAVEDVATLPLGGPWPDQWLRAHEWLVAMPERVRQSWSDVDALLDTKLGRAPEDGRLIGDFQIFSGPQTPFTRDELSEMDPHEAARTIAAWRPDPRAAFGPSPRGLERELQTVVKESPGQWAADAVRLVAELVHPTYIAGLFDGLEAADAGGLHAHGPAMVRAVGVVHAEPWPVERLADDDFDADQDWEVAKEAGVDLIKRLCEVEIDLGPELDSAWALVAAAARRRADRSTVQGESDAMTSAINRPSTRALEAAFSVAAAGSSGTIQTPPTKLLELILESLELSGREGLEARAIIAPRLPWVHRHAKEWWHDHRQLIFGDDAPDELGRETFALYVKWGRPSGDLLAEEVELYRQIVPQGDGSVGHALLGMLWGIRPWSDPSYLVELLRSKVADSISDAGSQLALMVRDVEDTNVLSKALLFWEAALGADLPPAAYQGFGDFALVESIESPKWLDLTERTLDASNGAIEHADIVAERASALHDQDSALRVLAHLMRGRIELWLVHRVAENATAALERSAVLGPLAEVPARRALKEALLEKGFYEARATE